MKRATLNLIIYIRCRTMPVGSVDTTILRYELDTRYRGYIASGLQNMWLSGWQIGVTPHAFSRFQSGAASLLASL